ncbi:MAG: hypothetical protein RR444_10965, partial [Oscillospiraceae bacterium]
LENMIKNGNFAATVIQKQPIAKQVGTKSVSATTIKRPVDIQENSDTQANQATSSTEFEPLAEWADILFELSKVNMPLCGVLNGSKAFTKDGFVYIGTPSTVAGTLMKQEGNASQLISVIENKTGIYYKIRIKSTAPKVEEQTNKLDEVLNRAKENGVKINEN